MLDFKAWCGMRSVHGAIDCTHIRISKSKDFPKDYYYYKTGGYTVVAQAVVDSRKQFMQRFLVPLTTKEYCGDRLFGTT
jgi:hypothetical protein